MGQVAVSPIQWITLIGVFSTMIGMLAFFIKMLDRSRSHGERIGKQEQKNEHYDKELQEHKLLLRGHIEKGDESDKKTQDQLTEIKLQLSDIKSDIKHIK